VTLAGLCVRRPVFAVMLVSFLVVLGLFSFRDLGVDLFPRADPATVDVSIRLPGATSEEVTTQVIMPIEDVLSTLAGLDELQGRATEGQARITARFVLERSIEEAAQDVREKVSGALRRLPPNILPPVIQKADPDDDPVITIAVASGRSLRETSEIADKQVRRSLETVDGVGQVSLVGARERQVRVFLDADKLSAHGLTINAVEQAIAGENVEIPGGRIVRGTDELGVRTLGRLDAVSLFGDVVVANIEGTPIRVRDVGRVEDTYAEPRTWNLVEGKEAVSLEVRRQAGTNTVRIIDAIKARLAQIERTLPADVELKVTRDASIFIKASIASLEEHLLLGSLLASLVVMLFIRDLRSVVIASLAIPTSIIATFTLLKAMGFTLNNMTLLALTLAVGIVIDDAIVVLENIVRYVEQKAYTPFQAAIDATREITLAVLATTLSLVIIFLPIAFMSGYARRYVNEFGWTMAFSILVSMLISFTLTPTLCSRFLKPSGQGGSRKEWAFFERLSGRYLRLLEWCLDHRGRVLAVALGVFLTTFPLGALVGRDWIPPDDQGEINLPLNLPEGTSIHETVRVTRALAERIRSTIPEVASVNPYVHEGNTAHSHVYVWLTDLSKRSRSNVEVADEIRKICATVPNLRYRAVIPSALGGGETFFPVRANILGPDLHQTAEIAKKVADRMRRVPGLLDAEPAVSLNSPELQVRIDRQRASDLGVRAADVARAVRLMIAGEDQISTYKEGDEQYAVTMQLLPEQQRDPERLTRLMIPSSKVGQVRLDNVAAVERGLGPARIDRFNRQFQVMVNANTAPGFPLDAAARATGDIIRDVGLPPGYTYRFSGAVKILDETTRNLIVAFLLASIFMYMVLASQFDSFLHPFTIMLSLPLSVPFALLCLWITGRTLNLWSALGMLLLLGIVKKNGILQVDYTNTLRAQGVPLREAILQANRVRLRPILMTTLSIVAGLVPTAIGIGAGSAQRSAVAVTIIGGQSLCLLLTLVVTPVAYSLFAEAGEGSFVRALEPLRRLRRRAVS
jgi:HAE1 family hydrophobic/amphiphilic exporter-1